jgi:hypothetical protein
MKEKKNVRFVLMIYQQKPEKLWFTQTYNIKHDILTYWLYK